MNIVEHRPPLPVEEWTLGNWPYAYGGRYERYDGNNVYKLKWRGLDYVLFHHDEEIDYEHNTKSLHVFREHITSGAHPQLYVVIFWKHAIISNYAYYVAQEESDLIVNQGHLI